MLGEKSQDGVRILTQVGAVLLVVGRPDVGRHAHPRLVDSRPDWVEDRVCDLDKQTADEDATLDERLTSLNDRLVKLEKQHELSSKRFSLYDGSDNVRRLSSFSQMATSLEARALTF